MNIDTSDYYPDTPGCSCEPQPDEAPVAPKDEATAMVSPTPPSLHSENEGLEKIADRISNMLSWILVPLMMPLYAMLLSFHLSVLQFATQPTKWWFCGIVFAITAVIPMLLILLLKKIGIVEDLGLNGRKERLIPYVITILSLGGAGWFMLAKGAPDWIGMFFFGGALAALVNMIINFRWKISAHAAAIAGTVALLVCISREPIPHPHIEIWIACVIGLAGLLGAARVWLGRHTVLQVLAGSAVGFLSVFFLTLF